MKLLIVSQYFYPEQFGVNDISSKLVALGHEVTVLTGLPNYPMGEIYEGYSNDELVKDIYTGGFLSEINGVKVYRCKLAPRKNGKLNLAINYLSFAFQGSLLANNIIKSAKIKGEIPFDRVLVTQYSPVTMAIPAILIKKKLKIPFILYCFDLWPESIVSVGLKNHGLLYNIIKIISQQIYRQTDKIIISSRNFEKYFNNKLKVFKKMVYLPMYAEDIFTANISESNPVENSSSPTCNIVFAGNIGKMQSVDTIIMACSELNSNYPGTSSANPTPPIIFHIIGDGSALKECIEQARELGVLLDGTTQNTLKQNDFSSTISGVVFHGRHPLEEMPEFYNMADAMLITLKNDDIISYTLPNKVQTYMAAGKPILAAINGEAAVVINEANCGSVCAAEDYHTFAKNILLFSNSLVPQQDFNPIPAAKTDFSDWSKNSRDYYEKHFSSDNFIKKLLQILE